MPIEMQVTENFSLSPIGWNYEEVKREIAVRIEPYKTALVTSDAIALAKTDLASLRKVSKAINDRRIEIKKEFEKPYKVFEEQVKDVLSIIDEGVANIDRQVKAFDEAKKQEKREAIRAFYQIAVGDLAEMLPLDRIWNPRWENAGYKQADIEAEISTIVNRLRDDIETVRGMKSPYETELLHTLFQTLDLSAVLKHSQALDALSAANNKASEETPAEPEISDSAANTEAVEPSIDTPVPLEAIDIRLWCTAEQKHLFRQFLNDNGIKYGRVPKE